MRAAELNIEWAGFSRARDTLFTKSRVIRVVTLAAAAPR
jgi:hypothetical protein